MQQFQKRRKMSLRQETHTLLYSVPETGVEPVRAYGSQEFKSGVSTSSTTRALGIQK